MKIIRPNAWVRSFYKGLTWQLDHPNTLALTFDDGPHPEATPYVLELLKKYNIQATFFFVGKNVQRHPVIARQVIQEGHTVGNHTMHHTNGWKTNLEDYIEDIKMAETLTSSSLFRPPYGKITKKQARTLQDMNYKIIMWTLLTYDFDTALNTSEMITKIKKKTADKSIVTFHDSAKALPQLKQMLPELIAFWQNAGYQFKAL